MAGSRANGLSDDAAERDRLSGFPYEIPLEEGAMARLQEDV